MHRRTMSGQSIADYAIALTIIAIVIAIAIVALGGNVSKILSNTSGGV
jgi:Flp pilus assembly pilin Flp